MKGLTMRPRLHLRRLAEDWRTKPALRSGLRCAATFFAALLLSAAPLDGRPLPLAACLVPALTFFPYGLLAALGAIAGSVLLWPWAQALEPLAVTVLCFAAAGLFHDAGLPESELFAGLVGALLSAAVGFVFLLDRGFDARNLAFFAAKALLAFAAPILWRRALLQRRPAALWAGGLCLFVSLACLAQPVSAYLALSLGYAVSIATGRIDILPTLLCGLGLELTGVFPWPMTAPLAGAALLCRVLPKKETVHCAACFALVALGWQLLCGELSVPFTASCLLGCFAGVLLPRVRFAAATARPAQSALPVGPPLRRLARVFGMMHRALSDPVSGDGTQIADIYDAAAETVCRMCVRYRLCWEQNAAQTYRDLCEAAGPMLQRGCAVREDFPAEFAAGCCHMEGFLTALNQELDQNRSRRRLRSRLSESRRVLASQYLFLSRFLGALAEEHEKTPPKKAAFVPEFAAASAARPDAGISGDRGASFRDRWNHFYVLLCDGMGSGEDAAQQSGQAVRTLSGLLEAGVAPDSALELLNGFYVLREDSSFSTVDLLQADLTSGTGVLYKWGAAPSYLKTDKTVETVGRSSLPPGVSAGPATRPEQIRLALQNGQILILVSDGVFGEQSRKRVEAYHGTSATDLAARLVAADPDGDTPDDRTAAVVRLKRISA